MIAAGCVLACGMVQAQAQNTLTPQGKQEAGSCCLTGRGQSGVGEAGGGVEPV
jgi:hypothetical protein